MRILFALLVAVIAGCKQAPELPAVISPYKIDIQQGNVVTQEMVAKLKVGQTRSQVRFVLGSPLVADAFHPDRWDYLYLYQRQGKPDERRRLTVIFDADKLLRIEGDVVATDGTREAEQPAAKPAAKPKAVAEKPVAPKPEPVKPVAKPVEKPAEKPVAAIPAAPKPEPAKPDAAKPAAAATAKPAEPKPEATKAEAAADTAAAGAAPASEVAKTDSAKTDVKPEAASTTAPKTEAAKADEKKEKPKEKGIFGRMLDKIGF